MPRKITIDLSLMEPSGLKALITAFETIEAESDDELGARQASQAVIALQSALAQLE